MTTRYRSIASLQRDNRRCRACAEAGFHLGSTPIVEGRGGQRAYLYGQAPGVVEAEEGRPWRGRAGRTLRGWLDLDEDAFYAVFYCAAVTRCYPGKAPSGRGDRTPTPKERALCAVWREHERFATGFHYPETAAPDLGIPCSDTDANEPAKLSEVVGELVGRKWIACRARHGYLAMSNHSPGTVDWAAPQGPKAVYATPYRPSSSASGRDGQRRTLAK